MMLYKQDLDAASDKGCETPGCDCGRGEGLFFSPRCHPGSTVIPSPLGDRLTVQCGTCLRPMPSIAIESLEGKSTSSCGPEEGVFLFFDKKTGKMNVVCSVCKSIEGTFSLRESEESA